MWNRVKNFITVCSTSCMFVLLSATRFGISLWHYSFGSNKMCYSTSSHIWTFVTQWLPWRHRSPAEIAARWRYRTPIKNMTAHYNSQFFVSFHCCLLQEAQKCLWTCLLIKSWSSWQHLLAGKRWRVVSSLPFHLVIPFTLVNCFRFGWQDWCGHSGISLIRSQTSRTIWRWEESSFEISPSSFCNK